MGLMWLSAVDRPQIPQRKLARFVTHFFGNRELPPWRELPASQTAVAWCPRAGEASEFRAEPQRSQRGGELRKRSSQGTCTGHRQGRSRQTSALSGSPAGKWLDPRCLQSSNASRTRSQRLCVRLISPSTYFALTNFKGCWFAGVKLNSVSDVIFRSPTRFRFPPFSVSDEAETLYFPLLLICFPSLM